MTTMFAARLLPVERARESTARPKDRGVGHGEVVGVVNDDAAFAHLFSMGLVGFLVKCDQDVYLVAGTEDGFCANPGLGPGRPSQDLGRERRVGQGVVADLRGRLGQSFSRSNDALSAFTGEPDDEVVH